MISGRIIFISPLDWGLGHATRCVPLIQSMMKDNTVVIGVTPLNAPFFNRHFPDLPKAELPSYKVSYSRKLPAWLKVLLQWPKINSVIKKERKTLEKIISHYEINLVISDNRYGLTHKQVECVFMSHQLNLKALFFSSLANKINRNYIHRFNEVWVPDYENKKLRLSGALSDSGDIGIPVKYIGPQSMLSSSDQSSQKEKRETIDYLILLSGVEPQRSILEKLLIEQLDYPGHKIVLIRGSAADFRFSTTHIHVIDLAYGNELRNFIVNAGTVICRSGYSTLMDMHALQKSKLILIPTPGQTEQEYLAKYWNEKFGTRILYQKNVSSFRLT